MVAIAVDSFKSFDAMTTSIGIGGNCFGGYPIAVEYAKALKNPEQRLSILLVQIENLAQGKSFNSC